MRIAHAKGANRLIVLPTGYTCANRAPPMGAIANALHALTLLIARQLAAELDAVPGHIACNVVPPLCPFTGSPYDFSMTAQLIDRAFEHTDRWLDGGGMNCSQIPDNVRPHEHRLAQLKTGDPTFEKSLSLAVSKRKYDNRHRRATGGVA